MLNKTKILRGGIGCLAFLLAPGLVGCGGGGEEATTPIVKKDKSTGDEEPGAAPTGTATAIVPGGQSVAGLPGQTAEATGPVRVATAKRPMFGARKDPFFVDWRLLPPPPNVFEEVQPQRLASLEVIPPVVEPVTIREVSPYRVSGVMTGDGIFAILEGVGQPEVVKPGSKLPNGYTVVAINDSSVRLEKKEGKITYVQTVDLSDGTSQGGGGGGGGNNGGFGGGNNGFGGSGRPGPRGATAGGAGGGRGGAQGD